MLSNGPLRWAKWVYLRVLVNLTHQITLKDTLFPKMQHLAIPRHDATYHRSSVTDGPAALQTACCALQDSDGSTTRILVGFPPTQSSIWETRAGQHNLSGCVRHLPYSFYMSLQRRHISQTCLTRTLHPTWRLVVLLLLLAAWCAHHIPQKGLLLLLLLLLLVL